MCAKQVLMRGLGTCSPLDYKSKHNKHPTEGIWQDLDKTELEVHCQVNLQNYLQLKS